MNYSLLAPKFLAFAVARPVNSWATTPIRPRTNGKARPVVNAVWTAPAERRPVEAGHEPMHAALIQACLKLG